MTPDFTRCMHAMAGVIVRIGVNLQPGQPLLITEPYELQGVHPEASALVAAIKSAATGHEVTVISADLPRLRLLAEADNQRGFEILVRDHTRQLERHLARGGAFLFLLGSQPQLMAGLPADRLAAFDRVKWRHLGSIIQRLIRGETQWTLAPVPTSAWADTAYVDLPAAERLPALHRTIFAALRVDRAIGITGDPIAIWPAHLAVLARRRDELNAARHRRIRYTGPGTDLTLELPGSHRWCTAQLVSKGGVPFVVNLPTEEVFTAPHKGSASGTLRVSRPVVHSGAVIDGIELEFRRGRVVTARAKSGQDALQLLLATDDGAVRVGEVALVENAAPSAAISWQNRGRLFHHTLLDENAANHIALGDAYRFCNSSFLPLSLNSSQVHLDLPLDAKAELA